MCFKSLKHWLKHVGAYNDTLKTAISYMDRKIRPINDNLGTGFKIHIGPGGS